ncbi:MAG: peptidase MA family metallohydrolase [bacterium]
MVQDRFRLSGLRHCGLIIGSIILCLWVIVRAGNCTALSRSLLPDGPSGWLTVQTPHFLIRYQAQDKYFSQELALLAERSYTRVAGHLGLHPATQIDIYLADSRELFTRIQPSLSPVSEQVTGLAYPGLSRILLLSPRAAPAGSIHLEKTFIHELTHILIGASCRPSASIPHWFNEGVSMLEAEEWNWHYQALMTRICITRNLIPLRHLDQSFPTDPDHLQTAYAQSISMVTFIRDTYGHDALRAITHCLLRGDSIDQALRTAVGLDPGELELQWRKHLRLVYTWVPVLTSSAVLWFIISLVFLLGYYRKRKISQATLSAWEEAEIEDWLRKQLDDLDLR